jgi:hypothetical protein
MTVAQSLKLNPNKEQVKYVLDNMESQADSDPTGNWQTHIEDLLYEQGLNVFALYEQGVNNYAKGGYVWVEKDNIMELGDFEDKGEVAFMSSREVSEGIDEWNDQLDTNYTTIKEFNDGEEYRRIMTVKEFEVYKRDWIKDNAEFKNGGRVSRSDMEEWFYDHDNEWQNDIEIDHQQWMEVNGEMLHTNLDLVEWAYNRYHFAQGGKTEALYETGGKYANEPHDLIEEHKEQYKSKADFIKDIDETLVILKDPTYNTKVKDGWSHDKHQIAVLSVAKNILASNKYSKGGITIEGNPYKDEAIYIYRDGVEVVSWNEDEYDEDDNVKDLAKEMYDLYKKDKKELGKRLDSISYAKGGSTYTDGSGLEDPADDDCQRPNEDCECESQADCNCVECEKDIKNDLYGDEYSTSSFSKEDVMTVAQSLKLNPNKKQVKYVLDNMESQADSDPTGNWQTHIEDLLYEQGVKKYKKGGKTDSVDVGEAVFGLDKWLPDDDDAIREYQEIEDEGSVEDMIDYLNSYADEDRLYSKYGLTNSDFSAIAKKIMKKSYAKGGIVVRTKNV